MTEATLSPRSVLEVLTRERLVVLGREFGVSVAQRAKKDDQIRSLLDSGELQLPGLIRVLGRDELRAALKAHGLDDSGRARAALAERLLQAAGAETTQAPKPIFAGEKAPKEVPHKDDIVRVRHRQYLVEDVVPPPNPGDHTLVQLVCLDDDNQGRKLQVLWELELGAKIESPESHGLGHVTALDEPRHFAAYLHALKWSATTASDGRLFQAPFRAGIKLLNHQLTPLRKALELPRANLFIADDVGLGKTIEAGLVLQELILRQRVDFVLIVCPASICLQWRDEMERRFGLHFEIYNRAFIARRRQERGFGVNPWTTHARFVISYQTLRRPEYRDPLLQHLGARQRKSLLVLDEAHTGAPSTASKYAIDSRITCVVRDIAKCFENRLFLSATPHNGHSNSFSALLELLDPQRFTRGVNVNDLKQLEPVMVRRLKEDLRKLGIEGFPERKVLQIDLRHENGAWTCRYPDEKPRVLASDPAHEPMELLLSKKLREYRDAAEPKSGKGKLVFINLQKRLLSSFEAFYRTLQAHARSVGKGSASPAQPALFSNEDEEYGIDDETQEETDAADIEQASKSLPAPEAKARKLLDELVSLAEQYRGAPDAKVLALLDWIRENQCPAIQLGGAQGKSKDRHWTDRRVILFTEWGDTKRYLWQILTAAVQGTDRADERILQFHGGMSDEQREEVQLAFNGPPDQFPVRILIATDAAREGVNLQGHCADLFHFDIPWNPARMEQRNGRIDRTLQAAPEVRCHYFFYPDRTEDPVLKKLVEKVDRIQRELGSLSSIVMDRLGEVMDRGIRTDTETALDEAEKVEGRKDTAEAELESQRKELKKLEREIDDAGEIFNRSRKIMDFDPAMLKETIEVGLELSGIGLLKRLTSENGDRPNPEYALPDMPDSWQPTLDALRPPRGRTEPFWEWRRKSPQPVVFKALDRMDSSRVHLHLQHPFVQRILSRFLAQGFSAHDLSRVTIVRNPEDALVRVVAFGRLSLFGPGAVRLHDQLVSVAARHHTARESEGEGRLEPFADRDDRKTLEMLERLLEASPSLDAVSASVRERLRASASEDFAALWTPIKDEADHLAHDVEAKLKARGRAEGEALRRILEAQREAIRKTIGDAEQLRLEFEAEDRFQKEQFEKDLEHMEGRLDQIDRELDTEPKQIEELYQVVLRKLEPVGLVYLWPETRG